jgi:hypothetical protein
MKKRTVVPRGTADPIGWLLRNGRTRLDLTIEWKFKTVDTIYRLQRGEYEPPPETIKKMAQTFGWEPGEVLDHWIALVENGGRKLRRAAR